MKGKLALLEVYLRSGSYVVEWTDWGGRQIV